MTRSYGTGSLRVRRGKNGRETWYGQVRSGDRKLKRALGPKRQPGSKEGLTKGQAEARLRALLEEVRVAPAITERITLATAAFRRIDHIEHVMERKATTIQDYRIMLSKHFEPFFGDRRIEAVTPDHVQGYIETKLAAGLSVKTIGNHLNFLNSVFVFAMKRGWAARNPVAAIDRPRSGQVNPDIHFLTLQEFEALLQAVPDDYLGPTERALYIAGATTGLRLGELRALQWRDVDFSAGVIRCRRSFSRGGAVGTPKSRRSSRAVPMCARLASELRPHRARSYYATDADIVFCHPHSGRPYDDSKLRKRFKTALKDAGVREIRFHDLRHTFGTHMAAAGAPLRAIQEWMGHADYKTTSIYADYMPDPTQGRHFSERAFGSS